MESETSSGCQSGSSTTPSTSCGTSDSDEASSASSFAAFAFVDGFGEVAQQTVSGDAYLVDITSYLPLGSCVQKNPDFDGQVHPPAAREWIEATELLPGRAQDEQWRANPLNILWKSQIVRIFHSKSSRNDPYITWRIYVLPEDVGRGQLHRPGKALRRSLGSLLGDLDISANAWAGNYSLLCRKTFDVCATSEDCSLYYMFNTLPSPSPDPRIVSDRYSRTAMEILLYSNRPLIGLTSSLYPYQRRSAAMMIQREVAPKLQLDPRLERRTAPDGQAYYYGAREAAFLKQSRFYESVRGGILAETMGLGKTIICIAVILATRSHWPTVPPLYSENRIPIRPSMGSLLQMAAAATTRHQIPWRSRLEDLERMTGDEMSRCAQELQDNIPFYDIPYVPSRFNRRTTCPPPQRIYLCTGTIIVVPGNLVHQWQSEFEKHITKGALRVLIMDNSKIELPPASELSKYDVVLFSRSRFELEIRDGSDVKGRRATNGAEKKCTCSYRGATRERGCECFNLNAVYSSPLKELHWLRLIIDEGHSFSSATTNAVTVAEKLVRVERRWVVSGTPAKDLLGVEVEVGDEGNVPMRSREEALEERRSFNPGEESFGAAKSLGNLASNFLKIRPWADCGSAGSEDKAAIWDEYIYRHAQTGSRTFEGFSICLRRTLEGMVVKTLPDDVEKDIGLPPLTHRIVRLEPSFYDKLTANVFVLVLTANAVTSERTDEDYLFHRNNRKPRTQLITNLRQSAFFWTGFSQEDVRGALEHGRKYLAKQNSTCTLQDRRLLQETINNAEGAVESVGWNFLSRSHEMGLFVKGWPDDSVGAWSFGDCKTPALMGITQLLQAQTHVNRHIASDDVCAGLAEAGVQALASALDRDERPLTKLTKTGIPQSSLQVEPSAGKRRASSAVSAKLTPKKAQISKGKESQGNTDQVQATTSTGTTATVSTTSRAKKRRRVEETEISLPPDSPLQHTTIVGTTSSKLSYLIDKVSLLHKSEKILIFYEGDNIGYYIAQALELLSITHLIYAKALANDRRSKYVVLFDTDPFYRVLLMDVKQAAHGLNLSSASRVFFVNPVCRPNLEAQAIKRAHRIGQVRPVEVETLVLKGTVEEAMLERSRKMSRHEHLDAKSLEDDFGIRTIIQNARVIPVSEYESYGYSQMAHLWKPQQLFGRPGRMNANSQNKLEMELFGDVKKRSDKPLAPKRRRIAKEMKQSTVKAPVPESQGPGEGLDHH